MEGHGGVWRGMKVWRGMEGYGGVWRGMEGYGGVWRGMEGYGGVWRGMEGYGGVWRAIEGYGGVCSSGSMCSRKLCSTQGECVEDIQGHEGQYPIEQSK